MKQKVMIVDLDGTLYYQIPVRILMIIELFLFYSIHPLRFNELIIILKYRKDHEGETFNLTQFSKKLGYSEDKIKKIIDYWMIKAPLKWIKLFRDRKLLKILLGSEVIVLSDYPTTDKLDAISYSPKDTFFFGDGCITAMKPNVQPLRYIQKKYHFKKQNMLVIGDRMEKDGLCAKNFGCCFIMLSPIPFFRYFQYRKIKNDVKK